MSRDITPFGLRMPAELKVRVDEAAVANGRSINAEVIDRLNRSFSASSTAAGALASIPDGLLLDEVISRYGAQVQILVAPEVAAAASIKPKRAKAK